MTSTAQKTRETRRRQQAVGRAVQTRLGRAIVCGWSGHDEPWPLVRLVKDPPYFGALVIQDDSVRQAALSRLSRTA